MIQQINGHQSVSNSEFFSLWKSIKNNNIIKILREITSHLYSFHFLHLSLSCFNLVAIQCSKIHSNRAFVWKILALFPFFFVFSLSRFLWLKHTCRLENNGKEFSIVFYATIVSDKRFACLQFLCAVLSRIKHQRNKKFFITSENVCLIKMM